MRGVRVMSGMWEWYVDGGWYVGGVSGLSEGQLVSGMVTQVGW